MKLQKIMKIFNNHIFWIIIFQKKSLLIIKTIVNNIKDKLNKQIIEERNRWKSIEEEKLRKEEEKIREKNERKEKADEMFRKRLQQIKDKEIAMKRKIELKLENDIREKEERKLRMFEINEIKNNKFTTRKIIDVNKIKVENKNEDEDSLNDSKLSVKSDNNNQINIKQNFISP